MVDIAETAREGLPALAVGSGLQVMQVLATSDRLHRLRCAVGVDPSVRVTEYTSEFGRWDEVERASDPRLRPYVHGYFATSSSLVRPARERHLPAAEVPMVLNFGASHTRVDAQSDSGRPLPLQLLYRHLLRQPSLRHRHRRRHQLRKTCAGRPTTPGGTTSAAV